MMKVKRIILFFFILSAAITTMAQPGTLFKVVPTYKEIPTVGIRIGATFPKMLYSVEEFNSVSQITSLKPALGMYVNYFLNRSISVAPEFMILSKAVHHNDYIFRNRYQASYELNLHYFALRVPLKFHISVSKRFKPYIYVAPDFSYCIGGKLHYVLTPILGNIIDPEEAPVSPGGGSDRSRGGYLSEYNIHQDITKSDIKQYDLSVIFGVGMRYKINLETTFLIARLDVGYNMGLIDNYGTAVTLIAKDMGYRYSRSIECMFSIGIPIKYFKDVPCVDFNSVYDIWY